MGLIDKYKPSDYCDSVSRRMKRTEPLSPDHIFEEMFCNFPKPAAGGPVQIIYDGYAAKIMKRK